MRLINFGVGEITDRLSILALKILHAKPDTDITHFTNEKAALLAKLAGRNLNGSWFEQSMELSAVNAAIWRGEDDLRSMRDVRVIMNKDQVVVTAFRLQEMNDRRHELITEINKRAGDFFGPEKDFNKILAEQTT